MILRHAVPLAALVVLAGCAGAPPPEHYGKGWTLLETCWVPVAHKACPDARGADADKCMAPVVAQFNAQRDAEAQRAFLLQNGCPAYVAGEKP
jgi:hypothetical protein